MRALASYIMRGRSQALLVTVIGAAAAFVLPLTIILSAAAVALVTLRQGSREGLFLIVIGGVLIAAAAGWGWGVPGAVSFPLAIWLPVWLIAILLRETVSLSSALAAAGLVGAGAILAVYAGMDDPGAWWQVWLDKMAQQMPDNGRSSSRELFRDAAARMTGMLATLMTVVLVLALLLARGWQAMLYNPGGFRREFHGLRFGRKFAGLTTVGLLLAVFANGLVGEAAENLMLVLVAVYIVAGLGLAHWWVAARRLSKGWLGVAYLLSLFLPQVLALAGFIDSWADVRDRHDNRHTPDQA